MKRRFRGKSAWLLPTWARLRHGKQRYVFILGHMRAGTTLLNHILLSHGDFAGCGERNAVYRNQRDLEMLSLKANWERRRIWRPAVYAVDQVNHSRFTPNTRLLAQPDVSLIFLIREPGRTLTSMLTVLARYYVVNLDEAAAYYEKRLDALCNLALAAAKLDRTFFLTYEELTESPDKVLTALDAFLELRTPLSADYRTFEWTGKRGDPSDRIALGRIDPEPRADVSAIPSDVVARFSDLHERCQGCLRQVCFTTDSPVRPKPA